VAVDQGRARELVARERERLEGALRDLTGELKAEDAVAVQQTGETDAGSQVATEMTEAALLVDIRDRLAAVARAEARIDAGTYGRSIEGGDPIPDERLEADPLAERTVEEQRRIEQEAR
jgi:RNA polymerase-binding transcription factor